MENKYDDGWGWRKFDEESPRWRNNVLIVGKDKIIRTLCINSYDCGDPLPGIEKENMIYWHPAPHLPMELLKLR